MSLAFNRMMSLFGGGAQQTPEQIQALRQKRQEYQDYLTSTQISTRADVNKKTITPESGTAVLNVIQKAQEWLSKNPNADLNTVLAQRETTQNEIRRILSTDKPKLQVYNAATMLPTISKEAEQKKLINTDVVVKLQALSDKTLKWYTKNEKTATSIEIDQQYAMFLQSMKQIVVDANAIEYIQGQLNRVVNLDTDSLTKQKQERDSKLQTVENQTVDLRKSGSTVLSVAMKTVMTLFLIVFFVLCGSFAANAAIGRPPAYRILYFLYGAFPLFAPLVLLYTIYRRIREGRLAMYAILPISIEPATTRIGRILWYPFYYVPDAEAVTLYKQFQESLLASATS